MYSDECEQVEAIMTGRTLHTSAINWAFRLWRIKEILSRDVHEGFQHVNPRIMTRKWGLAIAPSRVNDVTHDHDYTHHNNSTNRQCTPDPSIRSRNTQSPLSQNLVPPPPPAPSPHRSAPTPPTTCRKHPRSKRSKRSQPTKQNGSNSKKSHGTTRQAKSACGKPRTAKRAAQQASTP